MSTKHFQLNLDPDSSLPMSFISYAFPEGKKKTLIPFVL